MTALRASLRIARRDARRARGRSALVVAMIALPVAGVVAVDVIYRTTEIPFEQVQLEGLGAADALVRDNGTTRVKQTPSLDGGEGGGQRRKEPPDLQAALPEGARVLPTMWASVVIAPDPDRLTRTQWRELDYTDPTAAGLLRQMSGRAPRTAGEVALSTALAERTGLGVGDSFTTLEPERTFTVTGLVRDPTSFGTEVVVAPPGALIPALPEDAKEGAWESPGWLVDTPGDFTWDDVLVANEHGFLVLSRTVLLNPPPCSEQPLGCFEEYNAFSGDGAAEAAAIVALVVGMALLEVVLLAGPAFAVGARRSRRDLALVAATGGDRRHVRDVVLSGGLVLGVVAAVAGAAVGVLGVLAGLPLLERLAGRELSGLDLRPLEIGLVMAVGLLTAVLAAVLPARQAARQDVVAALGGRRGSVRTPRVVPALGLVAVVVGVGLAGYGAGPGSTTYILLGAVVAELGLVAMSPTLVALVARIGRWLPVAPRLALRDAARHRTRSGPAVSAIMAAVAGSIAAGVYVASDEATAEATYTATLPHGYASVSVYDEETLRALPEIRTAVESTLPVTDTHLIRQLGTPDASDGCPREGCLWVEVVVPRQNRCPLELVKLPEAEVEAQAEKHRSDPRCLSSYSVSRFGGEPVGDATLYTALTGDGGAAAREVLVAGGAVVSNPLAILDGRVTLRLHYEEAVDPAPRRSRRISLPAVPAGGGVSFAVFLSPAAAERTGGPVTPAGLLFETSRVPTEQEEDAAAAALARSGAPDVAIDVERGYRGDVALGLLALVIGSAVVALGAAGIATGLAAADGVPDLATLAAVGAAPRTRRWLAAAQAGVIAGLGTLLGVAAGFVPGIAAVKAEGPIDYGGGPVEQLLVVPWSSVGATLLVVPLLAVLCGWLFTRSRLPMVRRVQ